MTIALLSVCGMSIGFERFERMFGGPGLPDLDTQIREGWIMSTANDIAVLTLLKMYPNSFPGPDPSQFIEERTLGLQGLGVKDIDAAVNAASERIKSMSFQEQITQLAHFVVVDKGVLDAMRSLKNA